MFNKFIKYLLIIVIFNIIFYPKKEYFSNELLKVYIINLKSDKDKLKKIQSNFNNYNIKYNIFNGIDGLTYKLNNNDIKYLQNVDYDINIKKGVVGCHLSHIKLLELFVKKK